MKTIISNTYVNGRPDLGSIRRSFPQQGDGRIEHTTLLRDQFAFRFQRNPSTSRYDIFIERAPSYRGRACDAHSTHRHEIGTPRERICIKQDAMPQDLPTAVALAMWWAECTSRYIADGRSWSGGGS